MTASPSQQNVPVKDEAVVRKCRRRGLAKGAAEDCFTCSKRNVKCDRRRPYCSQCLEIGNGCPGYKIQLTWGVGVASRGKLRGLSFPIANIPTVSRAPKKFPVGSRRVNSTATVLNAYWVKQKGERHCEPIDLPSVTQPMPTPGNSCPGPGHDCLSIFQPECAAKVPQHGWSSIHDSSAQVQSANVTPKYSQSHLPLVTEGLASSIGVNFLNDYDCPLSFSQASSYDQMPFGSGLYGRCDGYAGSKHSSAPREASGLVLGHVSVSMSYPGLVYAGSKQNSSINSYLGPFGTHLRHRQMWECDSGSEHYAPPCPVFPF